MPVLITDRDLERRLIRRRKRTGIDRWDEVWEGVYVMGALPNDEHQRVAGLLTTVLTMIIELTGRGHVRPGVNVSDQPVRWKRNYRCPDVVVYLNGNPAENRGTHWYGGPDLAIEIVSPGEDPHAKLDFYAKVTMHEVLIIDRDPWRIELFRLTDGELTSAGVSEIAVNSPGSVLASNVVPFTWKLVPGSHRARIETTCTETGQVWHV